MASGDFRVISSSTTTGLSRYRLIDVHENEIQSVNEFLDSIALRGLSDETLRTYAYALLSVWKWLRKASLSIDDLTETRLADYIRYLREAAGKKRPPAPRSINLRLVIARSFYRFHTNQEVPKTLKRPFQPNPLFVGNVNRKGKLVIGETESAPDIPSLLPGERKLSRMSSGPGIHWGHWAQQRWNPDRDRRRP